MLIYTNVNYNSSCGLCCKDCLASRNHTTIQPCNPGKAQRSNSIFTVSGLLL